MADSTIREELFTRLHQELRISKASEPTLRAEGKISCSNSKIPEVKSGLYRIRAQQKIEDASINYDSNVKTLTRFFIQGPRFAIPPQEIHTVYPPRDGFGAYDTTLPHIAFNRETIPWELRYNKKNSNTPWMALMLFRASEAPKVTVVKPEESGFSFVAGEKKPKVIKVIEVEKNLLNQLKASEEELQLLSHFSKQMDKKGKVLNERAIVMANRLPAKGQKHVAHLVSLEAGYQTKMISLYSWEFSCDAGEQRSFYKLKALSRGQLQLKADVAAYNAYFQKGFVPMPHHILDGSQSRSWYHGPLLPDFENGAMGMKKRKNPQHPKDFLLWDQGSKMLDVSYAAAWQLGRLLTLQEKQIATELFFYKRKMEHYQQQQAELPTALSIISQLDPPTIPDSLRQWMEDLSLLKAVPLNYLLPHPSMLPEESIQFFRMDMNWVYHLMQGAMTVGEAWAPPKRLLKMGGLRKPKDDRIDQNENYRHFSGFLLHSQVVADYPDLQVEGFSDKGGTALMEQVVMRRLDHNLLLCIFKGGQAQNKNKKVQCLDLFLPAQAMYFGFETGEQTSDGQLYKNKVVLPHGIVQPTAKLDVKKLMEAIKAKDAASFAIEMVHKKTKLRLQR